MFLGYELGAHMGSIHEKNQGQKISCYCTFKRVQNPGWRIPTEAVMFLLGYKVHVG